MHCIIHASVKPMQIVGRDSGKSFKSLLSTVLKRGRERIKAIILEFAVLAVFTLRTFAVFEERVGTGFCTPS